MTRGGALAGVDVGASGIRLRVHSEDRSLDRRRNLAVPRREGQVDLAALSLAIVDELRPAMAELGVDLLQSLGLGMTGVPGLVDDSEDVARHLWVNLEVDTVAIASDAVITHFGALAGEPGVVVAAGTGMITLGTDLKETWRQVDGWGVTLGDEGSGAWVGRRGLQAALRSWDGRRGGSESLQRRMVRRFGGPMELVARTYGESSPAHELASFAPDVADAAQDGDQVAGAIWQEAAACLAEAAVAAARDVPQTISFGGGLFRAGALLLEPFRTEVLRALPGAQLRDPSGTALDGAVWLARQALAGNLASSVPYLGVYQRSVTS